MPPVFGVLFDGVAYGMLLFLLSVGLSVTLGMMNFVNLAHCSFAMLGGYVTVTLMNALRLAVLRDAAGGVRRRRRRQRRARTHLLPALLSTPANSSSACSPSASSSSRSRRRPISTEPTEQPVQLPAYLRGSIDFRAASIFRSTGCSSSASRVADHAALLVATIETTRFGAQVRAAVNNQRMARGLGIDVDRLFAITFALGSGLAGLGGALAIEMVGLDPSFALTYLIYVLIVVSVGGLGSIAGSFAAAMLLGVSDVAGKYYVPAHRLLSHLSGDDRAVDVAADAACSGGARRDD